MLHLLTQKPEIIFPVTFKSIYLCACLFLVIAFSNSELAAQVGKETSLWNWSVASPHHESIVQIESDGGFGTGVIIRLDKDKPVGEGYEGFCLNGVARCRQRRRTSRNPHQIPKRDRREKVQSDCQG